MTSYLTFLIENFFQSQDLKAYAVGGAVRDRLLNRTEVSDLDLSVQMNNRSSPQDIAQDLARTLKGSLVPLSPEENIYRIVVTGGSDGLGLIIDLNLFAGTIQEDLARRDFTINAMAVPVADFRKENWQEKIIDPHGGREDLSARSLRALSPTIFQEDPGRLLRAVRLSAQLGLNIGNTTADLIQREAHLVNHPAPERTSEEFLKTLEPAGADNALHQMDQLGILTRIIPELELLKGIEQPPIHFWDVWGHTLRTVAETENLMETPVGNPEYFQQPVQKGLNQAGPTRRTILKLAALFHDIAKPQTQTKDPDGRIRFLGHGELGAEVVKERLTRLRFSGRVTSMTAQIVKHHLRPALIAPLGKMPTKRAVYRYFRDTGDVAVDTLHLSMADYLATRGPMLTNEEWELNTRTVTHILQAGLLDGAAPPAPQDRLVNGHDLIKVLGLKPGPLVGEILAQLEEAQGAGEVSSQEEALKMAKKLLAK